MYLAARDLPRRRPLLEHSQAAALLSTEGPIPSVSVAYKRDGFDTPTAVQLLVSFQRATHRLIRKQFGHGDPRDTAA